MDALNLALILARIVGGIVSAQGKPELGGMLNDMVSAVSQGKQVDDILKAIATRWDAEGEPSFADIEAHRQEIQARMD